MGGGQSKKRSKRVESIAGLCDKYNEDSKKEADCQQKVDHFYSVFKRIEEASELKLKQKEEKIFELYSEMKHIDLVKMLNGKEYEFKLKRLINIKNMVNDIDSWLKNFNCSYDGCPNKATLTYPEESSNKVYCNTHSNKIDELKSLYLISELEEIRSKAYYLEKILVIVQERMFFYQNPNVSNDLLMSEKTKPQLGSKYEDLVDLLKTFREKVDFITKNSKSKNSKSHGAENKNFKYESLNTIKEHCNKCIFLSNEIFLKICESFRDQLIDSLIKTMINTNNKIQMNEEQKDEQYFEVPDEIYDKEYIIVHMPYQTNYMFRTFDTTIKRCFENIEAKDKVPYSINKQVYCS